MGEPNAEPSALVPVRVPGVDTSALKLDVMESLILDRVDGRASVAEISDTTGLDPDMALRLVEKLAERGVVSVGGAATPPAPTPSVPPTVSMQMRAVIVDPMTETTDLSVDQRRQIIALEERLDASFYDLLGVPADADKKAVRERYFALSKEFHPDAYYGKNLGTFRRRLEAIFGRITLAYEVLTSKERRAEYDGYLGERLQLDDARERMEESRQAADNVRQKLRDRVREARQTARRARLDEHARRQLLARKLAAAAGRRLGPPPAATAGSKRTAKEAAEAVKRLLGDSGFADRLEKAEDHATNAEAALGAGDYVAAANDFRMALALDARNAGYRLRYEDAAQKAREQLAEGYFKQGRFEEGLGDTNAAVQHYILAAEQNTPNADYPFFAAQLLLRLKKDLHRAREMALRSIKLRADDPLCHELLGLIYMEAGLGQSARRELETALELAPTTERIKEELRAARKLA